MYRLFLAILIAFSNQIVWLVEGGAPDWSVKGQIVYARALGLWIMNADGSNDRFLVWDGFEPEWSPDGSRLVFVQEDGDHNHFLYVINADGSNLKQLTTEPGTVSWPVYNGSSSWSPDSKRIVFQRYHHDEYGVYRINADGTGETDLTPDTDYDFYPRWSPDGGSIAFLSWRDGDVAIYLMNSDGSNQRRLTHQESGGLGSINWSPDGKKIVFTRKMPEPDGPRDIFVVDVAGGAPINLTNSAATEYWPVWSPDGSRIAFYHLEENEDGSGTWSAYTMTPDGHDVTFIAPVALTSSFTYFNVPSSQFSWAPDGNAIVFVGSINEQVGVFRVDFASGSSR